MLFGDKMFLIVMEYFWQKKIVFERKLVIKQFLSEKEKNMNRNFMIKKCNEQK